MSPEISVQVARALGVLVFTLAAAVVDWRLKKIPNKITVAGLAAGLVFNLVAGGYTGGLTGLLWSGSGGLLFAAAGFAVGFGMLFILWLVGSGGGGDVKYMGALGAWLGPLMTFQVFVIAAVITVVGSIFVLISEAMRLGLGRARARYATAKAVPTKGSADSIEVARQQALVKRRLMPWAVPAGIASWIVMAVALMRG
jgi:prepilin peptidase CpaA